MSYIFSALLVTMMLMAYAFTCAMFGLTGMVVALSVACAVMVYLSSRS